ncbi:MAG: septal ring lytic transglycosylase RlpA family protein [Spirochaetaceae bacterium]|jgi:rare lipoprotein A|nr:septal ring lytic transglycosylase RlpA family protein [Spirochaetaceae bacterium]
MKRITFAIVTGFALASLCSAQTGEVVRGFFIQEGIASWYGAEFNGKPTSSGEIFNDAALTAAHPNLPFGTMLKVTNQHNNKSVTVRVNDRGPFVAARIIDVSRAAAQQLDMIATGTAPVKIESLTEVSLPVKSAQIVKPVQPAPPPVVLPPSVQPAGSSSEAVRFQPAIPETPTGKTYRVQVGAYREIRYAEETYKKLQNAGLNPEYEKYGDYYRVVLPGLKQGDLPVVSERLGRAGFREVVLREEI